MIDEIEIPEYLTALICKVESRQFILPGVAIAEIVDFQPTAAEDNAPAWFLGGLAWRDLSIPLISLEALNHDSFFGQSVSLKIVVIHGAYLKSTLPYWGFIVLETPRITRLNKDSLIKHSEADLGKVEMMQADYSGGLVSLIDVKKVESFIAALK